MDLNDLVVFARVVQAGSFTSAARTLGMPKSTVSRKVSELEDHIGARLLQRTTRKIHLTDAGRIYHEHGMRIIAEIEDAEQAVGRMQASPRGLLRATAPLSFTMLGPIVTEFLQANAEVQVQLVCTDRAVDLVEEGFDVAIRAGQLGASSLIARNLGAMRQVVVAAPDYCKKAGIPKMPGDLATHATITFAVGSAPNVWTLFAGASKLEVRVTPRLSVNDVEMVHEAARDGLGIALLPEFLCADDLEKNRLKRVLPTWSTAEVPVHALYPSARHLSPRVASFIDLLRTRFRFAR